MSYETWADIGSAKNQVFKSDSETWSKVSKAYASEEMTKLTRNYTSFKSYIAAANKAIRDAAIEGISEIEEIDSSKVFRLNTRLTKLQNFAQKIHGDATTLIDDPFKESIETLLTAVKAHSSIKVSVGNGSVDLSTAENEGELYSAIVTIMEYGEKDDVEKFFEDYENSPYYDPDEYEKLRIAERIAKGGAPYSQEYIDKWLADDNNYLAYLTIMQVMNPNVDQGIESFLESMSNKNKAYTWLNPNYKMTKEQEKEARKIYFTELGKMDFGDKAQYTLVYMSRNTIFYDDAYNALNERQKAEYQKYEAYSLLYEKTDFFAAVSNGLNYYFLAVQEFGEEALVEIGCTALEMVGLINMNDTYERIEDVREKYDRLSFQKTNSAVQHPYGTITGEAMMDAGLNFATMGLFSEYTVATQSSKLAAFMAGQYTQFFQDATLRYMPTYLEYASDGVVTDAEYKALGQDMLLGTLGNLAFAPVDIATYNNYRRYANYDVVEPTKPKPGVVDIEPKKAKVGEIEIDPKKPGMIDVEPANPSSYKEVNVHGKINTELDEVDLKNGIIYEDKSAGKLYMENPDFPQTEQQWAYKQIYKKGSNRIKAISQPEYWLSIVGSEDCPSVESLKSIKKYVFRIDADTPALREEVEKCLNMLRKEYPEYSFDVIYGGK
ncbi:hypothetical protein [Butyrivibrio sp. INlla14]|uniref:hypothetical protein n=1 Tax=Butyrivibrio sp. INlla14 TaxID=1520808 RepID=UPI0008769877|nr:hypothetical protein [Butyrivibrio sp. INlla14]SCY39527.1 hypothetical protein SAMN02910371_02112 [Butyrivibrio sp. INlla14]